MKDAISSWVGSCASPTTISSPCCPSCLPPPCEGPMSLGARAVPAWLDPTDLLRGLGYFFKGLAILRRYPGLARYWSVPMFLTGGALTLSVVLTLRYHDDLLALLWRAPEGH